VDQVGNRFYIVDATIGKDNHMGATGQKTSSMPEEGNDLGFYAIPPPALPGSGTRVESFQLSSQPA
jgi:hypothetical protein